MVRALEFVDESGHGGRQCIPSPGMSASERRLHAGMLAVSALASGTLVAALSGNVPDAAHDTGVARTLGLDAQAWRALDALAYALLSVAPLGTHAERAALAGALIASASGVILYVVVRELLRACAETSRLC